jgi:hypothetical protein
MENSANESTGQNNTKAVNPLPWKDCFLLCPVVLRLLIAKAPFWSIALVGLATVDSFIPETREYGPLKHLCGITLSICISAASCLVVIGYWKQLCREKWEATSGDIARVGKVWIMSDLYFMAVGAGLLLLIVPGVIFAVRGSLALAIMCLEKRGPITAINDSSKLTEGKFWLTSQ